MYGLGNWAAVAEHVATKSEPDCKAHYYAVYVDIPSFPEPQPLPAMRDINAAQVLGFRLVFAQACRHATGLTYNDRCAKREGAQQGAGGRLWQTTILAVGLDGLGIHPEADMKAMCRSGGSRALLHGHVRQERTQ